MSGIWPTFRANAQRTGSLDPNDSGPANPRILWRFRCPRGSRIYASPAVVGGEVIFVATQSLPIGDIINCVYRVDATTGRLIQSVDLPRAGVSSPAVRGPMVYFSAKATTRTVLVACGSSTAGPHGRRFIRHAEPRQSSPARMDRGCYFGDGDDGIFALEVTDDGTAAILARRRRSCGREPARRRRAVFAGSIGEADQSPAVCHGADSGRVRWRVPMPLPVITAHRGRCRPAVRGLGNGKLDHDADRPAGALWCLDAATGNRQWVVTTTGSLYASPACRGPHVFIAGGDGQCQCLRQSDGQPVWQTPLRHAHRRRTHREWRRHVRPVAGRLAVVRFDAAAGHIVWRFDAVEEYAPGRDVHASPVLASGRIYLAAGNYLFCVGDRRE